MEVEKSYRMTGILINEPSHEKTNNLGFRQGLTQTDRCSQRSRLETRTFGFKNSRDCTTCIAKTKTLICAFVFEYADCWFSDAVAHIN